MRSGPCGSSGSTMMSVCMKRIGAPSRAAIGAVLSAIGTRASSICSIRTLSGMGPTPDEPVIVTCGTDVFASRRSIFCCAARTISRAVPRSSEMMKKPSTAGNMCSRCSRCSRWWSVARFLRYVPRAPRLPRAPLPSYDLTPCPVCTSSDAEQIASADDVRAEMEMLWEFHQRRLRPGTPRRALTDRVTFSQHPPLRLAQCRRCSLIYRNPRERAVELVETYAAEMPDEATLRTLHGNQRRAYRAQVRRLQQAHGRRGAGLEVGSYVGAFLGAARDAGWTFEGLDVNERAAAFACRMGFRVTVGELDDITGRRFDVVAIWNTFEQLPDPRAAAVTARHLLNPGGTLALRVPNGEAYATIRRA